MFNKRKKEIQILKLQLEEKEAIIANLVEENEKLAKQLELMRRSIEIVAKAKANMK